MKQRALKRHATTLHKSSNTADGTKHGKSSILGADHTHKLSKQRRHSKSNFSNKVSKLDINIKLDRETGVVSVLKSKLGDNKDESREADTSLRSGSSSSSSLSPRERAPSSPMPSPGSPPLHTPASATQKKNKRPSVLNGMRANLANRMLRLASKARTKIMVDGLDKSLAVSSTIVVVRMRPPNTKEKVLDARSVFSTTAEPVLEHNTVCRVGKRAFTYDVVIGPRTSQADVFKMTAKAVLVKVLAGFNGTVMAYGQTGSGKTYTMQGSTEQPGIIPRICANIFLAVAEDKSTEYNVKCSYVEIYNEMLHDLLTKEHTSPHIVEDPVRGITLKNVIVSTVRSQIDVQDLFARGAEQRAVGATEMNAQSSRSHAVFTIYVKSQKKGDVEGLTKKVSKFHLIDLAGSERADRTGASGSRLKEGAMINQSLSALGNVINALTKKNKTIKGKTEDHDSPTQGHGRKSSKSNASHVPYRSSKLTRLLQDSLGGNSYTMLICNISPAKSSVAETLSSLRFAERAKQVENKATINQDPKAVARLRLMKENSRLLDMVHALRKQLTANDIVPDQVPRNKVAAFPAVGLNGVSGNGSSLNRRAGHGKLMHSASVDPKLDDGSLIQDKAGLMRSVSAPGMDGSVGKNTNTTQVIKADADLRLLDMECMTLEQKLLKIETSQKRVTVLRNQAAERRRHLKDEQAMLEKQLNEIDAETRTLSLRGDSVVEIKDMLAQIKEMRAKLRESDPPAFSETSAQIQFEDAESPHRIKKVDLRKQQHARLRRQSITNLHASVGQMQRERIDRALDDIETDVDGFVDYDKYVDSLHRIKSQPTVTLDDVRNASSETMTKSDGDASALASGKRSPSTLRLERMNFEIDHRIGHHKVIVSTAQDLASRSLDSVLDQLQSLEGLLAGFEVTESNLLRDTEFQDEPVRYSWESTPSLHASELVEAQEIETDGSGGGRRGDMLAGQQETLRPTTNEAFVTRLHSAIRWNRSKEKWTTLLDEREDACNLVDQRNGNTALHLAAQNGHIDILHDLLGRGANVNAKNESGNTALHMTREYDLFWCSRALIKAGADKTLLNDLGNAANTGIEGCASDEDGLAALSSAHDASEVQEALDMLDAQQRNPSVILDKAKVVMCGMGLKKEHPELWSREVQSYFRGICNAL